MAIVFVFRKYVNIVKNFKFRTLYVSLSFSYYLNTYLNQSIFNNNKFAAYAFL